MNRSFPKRLQNLIWPKPIAFCLAAAVLLPVVWSVVAAREETVFVAVEVTDLPPGLVLYDLKPKGVEVQVSGPKYLIKALTDENHRLALDAVDVTVGINRVQIGEDQFQFPEGITLSHIHPPVVTLTVEKEMRQQVPVMVSVSGQPAACYQVVDAVAVPPSVTLSGPESVLSSLDKVMTEALDVKGLSESFEAAIALDIPESLTVESASDLLYAKIFIEERVITKTFSRIVVDGLGTSLRYAIRPETVSIEVRGPMNVVERMEGNEDIHAYVDLEALSPGIYVRPAAISLPLNTTLVEVSPEVFSITLDL